MQPSSSEFEIPVEAEQHKQLPVEAVPLKPVIESQQNPELHKPSETTHLNSTPPQAVHDTPALQVQASVSLPASEEATQSPQAAAAVADDVDLIEKTWVERAKSIIAKTKDDPYLQKSEISKVKAEYIQKRYNKKIKLADDTVKK